MKEVSEIWNYIPVTHLLPKIVEVTSFMARWGRSFFHKFRENIKMHKANLVKFIECNDASSIQEYLSEREKLNTLSLQEETQWKQRAKLFWLRKGDDNTRFFHASASAKKRANIIKFLVNVGGNKVENQEGMCEVVYNYFSKRFTNEEEAVKMMILTIL